MTMQFTEDDFLQLGLELCGWTKKSIARNGAKHNDERFRDKYYAGPKTLVKIFDAIQSEDLGQARIANPNPRYLLLALFYLKKYPTKHEMAGFLNGSEGTALSQSKRYVRAIQALKEKKITWDFGGKEVPDEVFMVSVDGVHCSIWEPRKQPSTGWYSKKMNKAGLSYEIGIAVFHNKCCWINGPFPAGHNDWKIFTSENGLASKIPEGHLCVGDQGYRYDAKKCSTYNAFDSEEVNHFKSRVKARHESFNSRLKSFRILSTAFRSTGTTRLEKHKAVFEAACVLVQYEMENDRPLFKV